MTSRPLTADYITIGFRLPIEKKKTEAKQKVTHWFPVSGRLSKGQFGRLPSPVTPSLTFHLSDFLEFSADLPAVEGDTSLLEIKSCPLPHPHPHPLSPTPPGQNQASTIELVCWVPVSLSTGIGWPTKCTSSGPPPVCSCTRWPRASVRRSTSMGSGRSRWTPWGDRSSTTTTTPWSTSTRPAPVLTPCPWSSGRWAHCTNRGRSASTQGPVTLRRNLDRNSSCTALLLYFDNPVNGMTFFLSAALWRILPLVGFTFLMMNPWQPLKIMGTLCVQLVNGTQSQSPPTPPPHPRPGLLNYTV